MINTKNEDIIKKYFDLVQDEIKRLISEDTEIKSNEVELFNNEIFNQPEEIQNEIRNYIDNASMNNLDIKKIAKVIYDKFKLQTKNNVFNQDDINDVPNKLMGERKYIKTFESFNNNFEIGDIVISKITELPYLIKGHRYIVTDHNNNNYIKLEDIVNNQDIYWHNKKFFISEYEHIGNKYNL